MSEIQEVAELEARRATLALKCGELASRGMELVTMLERDCFMFPRLRRFFARFMCRLGRHDIGRTGQCLWCGPIAKKLDGRAP